MKLLCLAVCLVGCKTSPVPDARSYTDDQFTRWKPAAIYFLPQWTVLRFSDDIVFFRHP